MTMQSFVHANASDLAEVLDVLDENVRPLAGGTDLVGLIKENLAAPSHLVNIKTVPALKGVSVSGGYLHVGATTTLAELAASPDIAGSEWNALYEALAQSASPQLRHMATLGGNLVQKPRCWYYRNEKTFCWRKGGRMCFAFRGQNRGHVLFDGGPCYAVHPSDPAVALCALDAEVMLAGPEGERCLPLANFFAKPGRDRREDHILEDDELITAILVPVPDGGESGVYVKVADRLAWDFALVSAAVQITLEGDLVRQASIWLGGVASRPWHAEAAEKAILGNTLTESAIAAAAEAATQGAKPLEHNDYKIDLIRGVVSQALERLVAS